MTINFRKGIAHVRWMSEGAWITAQRDGTVYHTWFLIGPMVSFDGIWGFNITCWRLSIAIGLFQKRINTVDEDQEDI